MKPSIHFSLLFFWHRCVRRLRTRAICRLRFQSEIDRDRWRVISIYVHVPARVIHTLFGCTAESAHSVIWLAFFDLSCIMRYTIYRCISFISLVFIPVLTGWPKTTAHKIQATRDKSNYREYQVLFWASHKKKKKTPLPCGTHCARILLKAKGNWRQGDNNCNDDDEK